MLRPKAIDLKKDRGLAIEWDDGSSSYYSIAYLRKMSPAADAKQMREEMESNPLMVLPQQVAESLDRPLTATGAELVGNYALRIRFSDGHDTGIYTWPYLLQLDTQRQAGQEPGGDASGDAE
jgi:DUF971 family protein